MNRNKRPNKPEVDSKPTAPLNNPKVNPNPAQLPISRGWRYYTGLTAGIFIGVIVSNMLLSYIFRKKPHSKT